jgi:8-amino-7-oxononanoate synthase
MKDLTMEVITLWIRDKLVESLKVPSAEINIDKDFSAYGIDSLKAVSMVGEIEAWIGKEIPATTLWDYTTIRQLASYLHEEMKVSDQKI